MVACLKESSVLFEHSISNLQLCVWVGNSNVMKNSSWMLCLMQVPLAILRSCNTCPSSPSLKISSFLTQSRKHYFLQVMEQHSDFEKYAEVLYMLVYRLSTNFQETVILLIVVRLISIVGFKICMMLPSYAIGPKVDCCLGQQT